MSGGAIGAVGETVGATAGGIAGGFVGGAVGSVFGPVGTVAGRFAGSRLGQWGGRALGGYLASKMESANEKAGSENERENSEEGAEGNDDNEKDDCVGQCPPSSGNIKKFSKKQLDKAAKENGYKDAHDLKNDYGLNSSSDVGYDKNGDMYYTSRLKGNMNGWESMNINKNGPVPTN